MTDNPDPIDVHVGERLRARRTALKQGQVALGKALGVTFQQVQKYERGNNRVSASMLQRAADFLGVDPAYFFPVRGEAGRANDPATALLDTPGGLELAQTFPTLPADAQESVLSIVRAIASSGAMKAALKSAA